MTPAAALLLSLADDHAPGATLAELLTRRASADLGVDWVAITAFGDDGYLGPAGISNAAAQLLEDTQMTTGEGPCHDAYADGRIVQQPDLEATGHARWPAFTATVVGLGARAAFAFPLQIGSIRLGTLDLYRGSPGPLSDEVLSRALVFADAALLVLMHLHDEVSDPEALASRAADVLVARPEVHQATGMVSVQAQVTLRDALMMLRAHAFAEDIPLWEVARRVLHHEVRFPASDVPRHDRS
ncbi:MAG: GAF and ANTAR domain-containing protein [Nocardioides sp.]|nr:GAF and ANTAR domain-containing protein [Nocardioides sp.]